MGGADYRLADQPATVAYNAVFISALVLAGLLALFSRSSRLGSGLLVGAGAGFAVHFITDIADVVRSGPQGTPTHTAAGPGFWWGMAACALALAGAGLATAALSRRGSLRLQPMRSSLVWAVFGLILVTAWLVGTWMPWARQTATLTVSGETKTTTLMECCKLSDMSGQNLAQALVITALLGAMVLVGSCLSSAAVACGGLVGAAVCAGADNVVPLLSKPYTLAELASAWQVTEEQLRTSGTVIERVVLPGAWIAGLGVIGLLLLAVARGLHGAAAQAAGGHLTQAGPGALATPAPQAMTPGNEPPVSGLGIQ
ncbi:hypothetical protein [Streptomyces zaomyceticus]|uniref:hypothetical protein n=1 Tax=Streptomyces zaomyceticus TaxID=68286 RepID=UPI00378836E6